MCRCFDGKNSKEYSMIWDGVSEPNKMLKTELNAAQILAYFDTNIIGDASESVAFLWRCREEGWIRIQRTTDIDTEHLTMKPELDYKRDIARELVESFTPYVLGHSRMNFGVFASEEDKKNFEDTFKILHPTADIETTRKNNVMDAKTVSGSARNGGEFLVTRDKGILRKSEALRQRLRIRCLAPEEMEQKVKEAIWRTVRNHAVTGHPKWMPDWVPQHEV
jgi:hypothetical protein